MISTRLQKRKTNVKGNFCNCFWLQHFVSQQRFRKFLNRHFFFKLNITFCEPNHISFLFLSVSSLYFFWNTVCKSEPWAEGICWASWHYKRTFLWTRKAFSSNKERPLYVFLGDPLFPPSMQASHNSSRGERNEVWIQGTAWGAFIVNEDICFSLSGSSVVARITNGADHYQNVSVSLAVYFCPVLNTILL